jgi:hypothetical protein
LKKQIDVLKVKMAELEAALEGKAEATTASLKEDSEEECQRRVTCRRVGMVPAAAPEDRNHATLSREQLTSDRVEARQNRLIDSAGVTEGDRVRPARNRKVTEASLGSTTWSTGSSDILMRR